MGKSTGSLEVLDKEAARNGSPGLVGTNWGYVIKPSETMLVRAAYGEMIALFFAVLTGMAAFGLWVIPGSHDTAELIPFKLAGTAIFFVIAGMLYLIAQRGLCHEAHVDLRRRELRTARRNRHGRATPVCAATMDEVERVYLQRSKASLLRSRLCVEFAGQALIMEVAEGSEAELAPILQRLAIDLNKIPRDAVVQRPAAETPERRVPTAFAAR